MTPFTNQTKTQFVAKANKKRKEYFWNQNESKWKESKDQQHICNKAKEFENKFKGSNVFLRKLIKDFKTKA